MPILWIYQSFKIKVKPKQNPNTQASLSREPVFEIVNKGSLVSDKNTIALPRVVSLWLCCPCCSQSCVFFWPQFPLLVLLQNNKKYLYIMLKVLFFLKNPEGSDTLSAAQSVVVTRRSLLPRGCWCPRIASCPEYAHLFLCVELVHLLTRLGQAFLRVIMFCLPSLHDARALPEIKKKVFREIRRKFYCKRFRNFVISFTGHSWTKCEWN